MTKIKILCIDDTPDEIIINVGKSLRSIMGEIFSSTPYELVYNMTPKDGIETAVNDSLIKLVLLDVEFNEKVEGPEIAVALGKHVPAVKIIVLTRNDETGNKISFGWKPNVVNYVLKTDLGKYIILQQLGNLARAVIEDYENKNWNIELIDSGTINLKNTLSGKSYGINIPGNMSNVMKQVIAKPNTPITNPGGSTQGVSSSDASLNKVINKINENVLERTGWNTWGILSRENCAKGQLKLVVGSVDPKQSQGEQPEKSAGACSLDMKKMRDDIARLESRIVKLEKELLKQKKK